MYDPRGTGPKNDKKNFEKITFRKWKKWWNQKLDFLQTSSVFTVDRPPM